ncbi:MAG: SIR2 family protein [bacterium]|nr:SIR2 family protein [bacterium]
MEFKSRDLILLTGAGFTKNFGGFLAKEMWHQIFNHQLVQKTPRLRSLLIEDYDFESVYSRVIDHPTPSVLEKDIMRKVMLSVYKKLDDATRGWVFNQDSPHPVNWYGVGKLFNLFIGQGDVKGFFFTLNQDLFMERMSHYRAPGAPPFHHEFYTLPRVELKEDEFVTLQREGVIAQAEQDVHNHQGLVYIKLHGSYGWKASDGSDRMVIGKDKTHLIDEEPLLRWYFDLFRSVIAQGNKKLLIIGYGFGDHHINKVLLEGVQKHNLRVFIISTQDPTDLREHFELRGYYYALSILDGLGGYHPYRLQEMFPADQSTTVYFTDLEASLLR